MANDLHDATNHRLKLTKKTVNVQVNQGGVGRGMVKVLSEK